MPFLQMLLIANLSITFILAIGILTSKSTTEGQANDATDLALFGAELNKISPLLREELSRVREEGQRMSRETREELAKAAMSGRDEENEVHE